MSNNRINPAAWAALDTFRAAETTFEARRTSRSHHKRFDYDLASERLRIKALRDEQRLSILALSAQNQQAATILSLFR